MRAMALLAFGLAAIGYATLHVAPLLIYNPSPSVPPGFYIRANGPPALGDFVTVRADAVAPVYAAARDYTDRTDRFIKRVSAVAGAQVCADGEMLSVDGRAVAERMQRDSAGRPLPSWSGCRVLAAREVLLLGDTPDSFDGRYWGPTPLAAIDGVWRRL